MPSINSVFLAGNLTRDVEVRHTQGGSTVGTTSLAINRKYKAKDGSMAEEVCFVDLTAWGRTAELMGEHLKKGSSVLIEGRLKQDEWDDKDTGARRTKLSVVIDKCHFLGFKEGGRTATPRNTQRQRATPGDDQDHGEVPF